MSLRERRQCLARGVDRTQRWKGRKVDTETRCAEELRHKATVGDAGMRTDAERSVAPLACEVRLDRPEAEDDPVPHPLALLLLGQAHRTGQELQDAQIVERVNVAGDHQRELASPALPSIDAGNKGGVGWRSSRYSMMASDWLRLTAPSSYTGRVERPERLPELLAAAAVQMDEHVLRLHAL